jgi:hypothetical protein
MSDKRGSTRKKIARKSDVKVDITAPPKPDIQRLIKTAGQKKNKNNSDSLGKINCSMREITGRINGNNIFLNNVAFDSLITYSVLVKLSNRTT